MSKMNSELLFDKALVALFKDENGISEAAYLAIRDYAEWMGYVFDFSMVDATDGRFYLSEDSNGPPSE